MAHIREVPRKGGRVAYEVRWNDGKHRQRTLTNRRDAERLKRSIEAEVEKGASTKVFVKSSVTVQEAAQLVLEAERHRLKPVTYHGYKRIFEKRIFERFGDQRISAVQRRDVQQWINALSDLGLEAGTVNHHYIALKKIMKWAMVEQLIAIDPCANIVLPRKANKHDNRILTLADVERVATHLNASAPYGLLVRFLAYTGLRVGEAAGLRVSDVELANRRILVRQTAQRVPGGIVFGEPKSARSTREVPVLDPKLLHDLKALLLAHPRSGEPNALFWPGRTPGSREIDYSRVLDSSSFLRNYFNRAVEQAGLPKMRVHDLRHTAASLWLDMGFPPYEVSRWLGHANLATTDSIYSHLYPTDYSAHIQRFEAYRASQDQASA